MCREDAVSEPTAWETGMVADSGVGVRSYYGPERRLFHKRRGQVGLPDPGVCRPAGLFCHSGIAFFRNFDYTIAERR